jgi:hypothetical protein
MHIFHYFDGKQHMSEDEDLRQRSSLRIDLLMEGNPVSRCITLDDALGLVFCFFCVVREGEVQMKDIWVLFGEANGTFRLDEMVWLESIPKVLRLSFKERLIYGKRLLMTLGTNDNSGNARIYCHVHGRGSDWLALFSHVDDVELSA